MAEGDIISRVLGPFGRFQLRTVLLIYLMKIPFAWFMACLIFTAMTPMPGEIFCRPPASIATHNFNRTLWIKAAHKPKYNPIEDEESYDFCNIYSNAVERYQTGNFDEVGNQVPCEEFASHPIYNSVVTQFYLICSRDYFVNLSQSFHLLGVLIGGIVSKIIVKYKSPRHMMLFGMFLQLVLGIATGYEKSFFMYASFRCLLATACSFLAVGITIATDITDGVDKVIVVCLFDLFWSIGLILLPLFSHWWYSWTLIYVAISLPACILITFYPYIPESPRWLVQHGKVEEAVSCLLKAARINKKIGINRDELEKELRTLSIQAKNSTSVSWLRIWEGSFRHKFRIFIAHIGFAVFLIMYFASTLNVRCLGRKYLSPNTAIAGCSEVVGIFICLYLILNTSKKWLWAGLLNIGAALIALTGNLVPNSFSPFQRMIYFVATGMIFKATISTTMSMFFTCATELVSNEKRPICGLSFVIFSRTLVLIAPFTGYFSKYSQLIPQNIMATASIIMSVLLMLFMSTPRTIPRT